jgi:hypothetical protein
MSKLVCMVFNFRQAPYAVGGFDKSVGSIQDQYRKLAQVLPALTTEVDSRRSGMETTLAAVKTQVQPMLAELQARKAQQSQQGAGRAGAAQAGQTGVGKKGTAPASTAAPAAALQKHLGRK